ncbi:hypothetical protein [Kineococcus glutinatus]|uniref:Uncharacterized protein n=1 Tax=Kineococcus glutinatus TaxID=1070872 RepID=A0ABP9HSY8_9ACTN
MDVVWRRSHGGRLLHALPGRVDGGAAAVPGTALCGARVDVDLRHDPVAEAARERCRRCANLLASATGRLPDAAPGMLF